MADWQAMKTEYITTDTSYRKLAEKNGVSTTQVANHAREEGWRALREQHLQNVCTKTLEALAQHQADNMARVQGITDKLLDKLEKAVDELNITLATNTKKTKVIEYNNPERPDKPTKEIIDEVEEIVQTMTIVDRAGLKAITSALRDIKEIQMLKSDLDKQEQEARIANLRKQADKDKDVTNEIEIIFAAGPEEWNE